MITLFTNFEKEREKKGGCIIFRCYTLNEGGFSKLLLQIGSETVNDKDGYIKIINKLANKSMNSLE